MPYDNDFILCECELEPLAALVEGLEARYTVQVTKAPSVCLTMVRAEDSLEKQEFYLGEALTTDCEVSVDGKPGYGVCLGEEPQRGYCMAVLDALEHNGMALPHDVAAFLAEQAKLIEARELLEFNLTLRTQVDFRLMEEE